MTEEERVAAEAEAEAKKAKETSPKPESVSIPKEEYEALMGEFAKMKSQIEAMYRAPAAPKDDDEDEDERNKVTLSEESLKVLQTVQKSVGQPLLEMIMTLQVKEEVRDCKDSHPDFKDYKADIFKVASANPSLSIEQAYHLAKSQRPPTTPPVPKPGDSDKGEKAKKISGGEKGGVPPSAVVPDGKLSIRDAALKAAKENLEEKE